VGEITPAKWDCQIRGFLNIKTFPKPDTFRYQATFRSGTSHTNLKCHRIDHTSQTEQERTQPTMPAEVNGHPLTSPGRLRKIDQLREKNIGKYLPLPQLVAVGDQSSGKSSLLESLTGIPFPHGQELCTRYATQITHRREDHPRIDISIIPGPHASPADKKQLELYRRQLQSTEQLRTEFPTILDNVSSFTLEINPILITCVYHRSMSG
jgi:Dynamin family